MKRPNPTILSACLIAGFMSAAVVTGGCTSSRAERIESNEIGLSLSTTAREIYAGEIVTVTARTQNLIGRDAELRWSTTGGELTTEREGRVARVKFDRPGTYIVSSQLFVNGEMELTEAVTVEVKPLR